MPKQKELKIIINKGREIKQIALRQNQSEMMPFELERGGRAGAGVSQVRTGPTLSH